MRRKGGTWGRAPLGRGRRLGGLQDSSPVSLVPRAGDVSRVIGSSLFQPPLTACRAPPFNSPFQSLRPPLLLSA